MKSSFDVLRLLSMVSTAGAELEPEGDKIRIRNASRLSAEILSVIKNHKADVLRWLNQSQPTDGQQSDLMSWLCRLVEDARSLRREILGLGDRLGYPAVVLGPGRVLMPGKPNWVAFVEANCRGPHHDVRDLIHKLTQ